MLSQELAILHHFLTLLPKAALPGEGFCDNVFAVKAHPNQFAIHQLLRGPLPAKCSSFQGGFQRIVLLLRDPYRAFFADFQRRQHRGLDTAHADVLRQSMWCCGLPERFAAEAKQFMREYAAMIKQLPASLSSTSRLVIELVYYEELTGELDGAANVIQRIIGMTSMALPMQESRALHQLQCALSLSSRPETHRALPGERQGDPQLTFETVYENTTLVCEMWRLLLDGKDDIDVLLAPYQPPRGHVCP